MLFSVLCTNSRDRFCFEFIRREEVEAWLPSRQHPMRHYFPLCVGFQEVLNANECVMRREPEKSQAGSRRDIGVNAPLSSHIYSSIGSADMDQKITVSQVPPEVLGRKNTNLILEWIIA